MRRPDMRHRTSTQKGIRAPLHPRATEASSEFQHTRPLPGRVYAGLIVCFLLTIVAPVFAQRGLEVSIRADKGSGIPYVDGERLLIQARASAACYLHVVYQDASGGLFLIFPNDGSDPRGHVAGATNLELGKGQEIDGFEFTITAPYGAEMLRAYASTAPLPLPPGEKLGGGMIRLTDSPDGLDLRYTDAAHGSRATLATASALLRTTAAAPRTRDKEDAASSATREESFRKPRIFGLVVGVSRYASAGIRPLQYADDDARAMAAFLADKNGAGIPPAQLRVLIDEDATRENILDAFRDFLSTSESGDLVYIYFAGHGITSPEQNATYFLSSDADLARPQSTAVDQAEITALLTQRVKAGKIVFFIDACHGGGLGLTGVRLRGATTVLSSRLLTELVSKKDGTAFFSASRAAEQSQEGPRWDGHGVFTYYLVKGLRGAADANTDAKVTVDELADYVGAQVKSDTGGRQHPELKGFFDNDLVLSVPR